MLETARFWASQIETDDAGRGHLRDVIGPDEYHELVDDNAYTNVMARANLRWAAGLARRFGGAGQGEISEWLGLADSLVDGYDESTGLYEQFAGYSALEPLLIEDVAPPPIAADVLLGHDRVAGSQLVKQADVLMLHHLVPEEVAPGSLGANLRHYLPRTAHGSSLSPPIHASLLARAGRVDEALEWFRLTARLDLEDITGTSAGGVHLGAMGGLWQALTFGFLGVSVDDGALRIDPRLPRDWDSVTQNLVAAGVKLRLTTSQDEVTIEAERPLLVSCGDQPGSGSATIFRFVRTPRGWEEST
jgi:trehalose/maltose hydrolase-like predicted phosphorylase